MLEERKVTHSGIVVRGIQYYHYKLIPYLGTNVFVRLKGERLEVYNCHGARICTAKESIFVEGARAK